MKSIAEQLKDARVANKLTQQQLADKAFLTLDTINRIEKQRTLYTYVHTLQQLQKALNIQFYI